MSSAKKRKLDANCGILPGYSASITDELCRERYREKLRFCGGVDPYEMPSKEWKDDLELWPSLSYIHVGMYLLFSSSAYTQEQLMDYKNLDCYQKFASGWVREVLVKRLQDGRCLMIAKVNHSQRLSEKPLTPWIICEGDGRVLAAHCDCMAGLGESCSHVGCLMWAVEAGAKRRSSLTVTDKRAYWVLPGPVKNVEPSRVKNIKFSEKPRPSPSSLHHQTIQPPSASEMLDFMTSLSKCKTKPALLSIVEPFSMAYIPKSLDQRLPKLLSSLFEKNLLLMSYGELLALSSDMIRVYQCNESEIKAAEELTREQSKSKVWFQLRAGRITASRLKAVCVTSTKKPSMSLLMGLCYPELHKFQSKATSWGCKHEDTALQVYVSIQKNKHQGFFTSPSGLVISPENGFMAASPDCLTTCSCCGDGLCEIKCPFCHKDDTSPLQLMKNKALVNSPAGDYISSQLKQDHPYFYQVQAQMYCTNRVHCDLVIWSPGSVYVQRIQKDVAFLEDKISRARDFVLACVLPELIGRWYSRPVENKENQPTALASVQGLPPTIVRKARATGASTQPTASASAQRPPPTIVVRKPEAARASTQAAASASAQRPPPTIVVRKPEAARASTQAAASDSAQRLPPTIVVRKPEAARASTQAAASASAQRLPLTIVVRKPEAARASTQAAASASAQRPPPTIVVRKPEAARASTQAAASASAQRPPPTIVVRKPEPVRASTQPTTSARVQRLPPTIVVRKLEEGDS